MTQTRAIMLNALSLYAVALVLAGLVWVIWAMVNRQSCRPLIQIRAWALLAVITLPWCVYVQWRYPEFFHFFVLEQHLGTLGVPVIYGLPLGHGPHLASIPFGVMATLDADKRTLTIDEPGVR